MLTNRKKLKNRRKKLKLLFGFITTILIIGGILGYLTYTTVFAKIHYISPLAKNNASNSIQTEKTKDFIRSQLKDEKIEYLDITSSEYLYIIRLKNGGEVILTSRKDLASQISSLQFIILRLTMEGRRFKKIDLQFDKPIIIFE